MYATPPLDAQSETCRLSLRRRVSILISASICLMGCGGGAPKSNVDTVKASGVVLYKGTAVENAEVVFVPLDGKAGGTGRTDAQGRFTLTATGLESGVRPGSYQVVVVKSQAGPAARNAAAAPTAAEEAAYVPPAETPEADPAEPPPAPKSLLPARYALAATTPLKVDVPAGGSDSLKLELTDE